MTEHALLGLASVVVLGIAAQWLAWFIRLPSIFLLLLIGLIAGPFTGWLNPQDLLGELLFPAVSLSVAVILFEGGLTLRTVVLRDIGRVLQNLVTLGVLVTWIITSVAAHVLLGLDRSMAVLIGAMLVVSGPTVVAPLLRHVRPIERLRSTLQWEGILIDPIGVLLAVLVFEAILIDDPRAATTLVITGMLKMVVLGSALGFVSAKIVVWLIQHGLIPDYLHNAVTLMIVMVSFTLANVLHHEAGLFTVTVMGIVMANQNAIVVRHIIEFKETLTVLLISGLFILLSARLDVSDLTQLGGGSLAFLAVLILIARPAAVALSTIGSDLRWQERAFLAWVAPRGIVAAAMASIFTLRLQAEGYAQADQLVPITFLVIIGCVAVYGLTAAAVAHWLGVAQDNPQGVLFIGASPLSRALAEALQAEAIATCLVDTNWPNIAAARLRGLKTHYGNALAEGTLDNIDLGGIGRVLALTPNDEANALAALHFTEIFGRSEAYQLVPGTANNETVPHLRGHFLFDENANYNALSSQLATGASVKTTGLSEQFDYEAFQAYYQFSALPLFVITSHGNLRVWTTEQPLSPIPGQRIVSLIPAETLAVVVSDPVSDNA
jgi:NhaP-type Na+/H+ or K+/H+ antiporter